MKILVTGGLGFIGRVLVDELVHNHSVYVIDNLSNSDGSNKNRLAEYIICDIADAQIDKFDVIFHLAAPIPHLIFSDQHKQKIIESHAINTTRICEAAKATGAYLICASSVAVHVGKYLNVYAFSKILAEDICEFYRTLGVNISLARFNNVYGDHQPANGIYKSVIKIFLDLYNDKLPLTVVGDGRQMRDFIHVNDVVYALIEIMNNPDSKTYDIKSGIMRTINSVAEMFGEYPVQYIPKRDNEIDVVDDSMAINLLYKNTYSLEQYIKNRL